MATRFSFFLTALFFTAVAEGESGAESRGPNLPADLTLAENVPEDWRFRMQEPPDGGVPGSRFHVAAGGSVLLDCDITGWNFCRYSLSYYHNYYFWFHNPLRLGFILHYLDSIAQCRPAAPQTALWGGPARPEI